MDKIDNKKTLDCYQAKHISSGAHQDQSPVIREIGCSFRTRSHFGVLGEIFQIGRHVPLRLIEARPFPSGVVLMRYTRA